MLKKWKYSIQVIYVWGSYKYISSVMKLSFCLEYYSLYNHQNLHGTFEQSGLCLVLDCWLAPPRLTSDSPYWMPEPIRSGSSSPVSILASIVLEHLRNASSTLSPVLALVSKKIKSFSCANLMKETWMITGFIFGHLSCFLRFWFFWKTEFWPFWTEFSLEKLSFSTQNWVFS